METEEAIITVWTGRNEVNSTEEKYRQFFIELEAYEKCGIPMSMDGEPASPLQIVSAHMAKESSTYMRDYVMDDKTGSLKELHFQKIETK
mgnify:CR=1 FL=1